MKQYIIKFSDPQLEERVGFLIGDLPPEQLLSQHIFNGNIQNVTSIGSHVKVVNADLNYLIDLKNKGYITEIFENTEFTIPYIPSIGAAANVDLENNWGFNNLKIEEFQALGLFGQGVKIAILDSGIDLSHECFSHLSLSGYRSFGKDGMKLDESASDSQWHGTHVASIVSGKVEGYNLGIAPMAHLYVGKVLHGWSATVASIKSGLRWLIDDVKPDLVNLSLGWPGLHPEWEREVNELIEIGTILCIATGNEYDSITKSRSPGNYTMEQILSVGAYDINTNVWEHSGGEEIRWNSGEVMKGATARCPKVVAPGVDILAASSGGGYRIESGTSMAAPHVTGLISILLSSGKISQRQIISMISESVIDKGKAGWDERFGLGTINIDKLLSIVREA